MKEIFKKSLVIALVAIIFDALIHYFFTAPMETLYYFIAKFILYSIYSYLFLKYYPTTNIKKIIIAGIGVASIWGIYYNVAPYYLGYVPYGISLKELSFLGQGLFLTALLFGLTHAIGFVVGVLASQKYIR